jgi:hypothetical protein
VILRRESLGNPLANEARAGTCEAARFQRTDAYPEGWQALLSKLRFSADGGSIVVPPK